ncbi:MAG: FAD-binding protein [Clostridiales bacterium]|nr:FAD-binding protein [Clostridiales bacterium]
MTVRKDITCDVMIIGGGSSGLWAARTVRMSAPESKVLIVDKASTDWGGVMSLSGGDLEVCMPADDPGEWVKDFVYYWDGLCEQDVLEEIWAQSHEIFEEYEKMGCQYLKDENGEYRTVLQRSLGHVKLFPVRTKGTGGANMRECMIREMNRLQVDRMGRVEITKLLKEGDRVCGAVGFNSITGDVLVFHAKAVILCSGNMGWKPNYNNNTICGEGQSLAIKAGARLRNCEFMHIWNVPKLFEWEGQTTLMPLGAKYINKDGEDFMRKYSPNFGANTDPHYLTRGMALEIEAGRGPITMDLSAIPESAHDIVRPADGRHLLHYEKLLDEGIDFFRDKLEWITQVQLCNGAIVTDREGRTDVEGLYAAGRCRSIDPGVYMGGFALMTTAITGRQAGKAAAAYIQSIEQGTPEAGVVQEEADFIQKPLGREGMVPKEALLRLQALITHCDVSILKTGSALKKALEELTEIKEEVIPCVAAPGPHYLLKLEEVTAIGDATEYFLTASLFREESRAGHYRADFPKRSDDWLCWTVLNDRDGRLIPEKMPMPVGDYRYPVEKYYSDNFTF